MEDYALTKYTEEEIVSKLVIATALDPSIYRNPMFQGTYTHLDDQTYEVEKVLKEAVVKVWTRLSDSQSSENHIIPGTPNKKNTIHQDWYLHLIPEHLH